METVATPWPLNGGTRYLYPTLQVMVKSATVINDSNYNNKMIILLNITCNEL